MDGESGELRKCYRRVNRQVRDREWNGVDGENKEVDSRDSEAYRKERSSMRNEDDVGGRARVT